MLDEPSPRRRLSPLPFFLLPLLLVAAPVGCFAWLASGHDVSIGSSRLLGMEVDSAQPGPVIRLTPSITVYQDPPLGWDNGGVTYLLVRVDAWTLDVGRRGYQVVWWRGKVDRTP